MNIHRLLISAILLSIPSLQAQSPCTVALSTAVFSIHHATGDPVLSTDPTAQSWKNAAHAFMSKDCSRQIDYPQIASEIRGFWTDTALYLLFRCPYNELNLFLPPEPSKDRVGLWDRDVVEMFLGDDWQNIRHYREFEIAPTADRIDLAIDLDHEKYDHAWDSGWQTMARIDEQKKIWYAAAKIPLSAVTSKPVTAGTKRTGREPRRHTTKELARSGAVGAVRCARVSQKWRANLYRIDGLGADPVRHFLCWQPTCVQNRDPNHVPEHFGTLAFIH